MVGHRPQLTFDGDVAPVNPTEKVGNDDGTKQKEKRGHARTHARTISQASQPTQAGRSTDRWMTTTTRTHERTTEAKNAVEWVVGWTSKDDSGVGSAIRT